MLPQTLGFNKLDHKLLKNCCECICLNFTSIDRACDASSRRVLFTHLVCWDFGIIFNHNFVTSDPLTLGRQNWSWSSGLHLCVVDFCPFFWENICNIYLLKGNEVNFESCLVECFTFFLVDHSSGNILVLCTKAAVHFRSSRLQKTSLLPESEVAVSYFCNSAVELDSLIFGLWVIVEQFALSNATKSFTTAVPALLFRWAELVRHAYHPRQ